MSHTNRFKDKLTSVNHKRTVRSIADRTDRLFARALQELNIDDEPLRQPHIMNRFTPNDRKQGYALLPTRQELHDRGKLVTDVSKLTRDSSPRVETKIDTDARFSGEHPSGAKVASFVDRVREGVDRSATPNKLGEFGLDHAVVVVISTADGLMTQNPDGLILPLDATGLRVDTHVGFDLSKIGQ